MTTVQPPDTPHSRGIFRRLVMPGSASPAPVAASGGAVRAPIAVAAVPSVASLVWTAWSLVDMIPAPLPVGLAAGVVLDVALVSAVAIAWVAPAVARPAKVVGWSIALLAAVLVGWHAAQITPILAGLGLIPLVSKGLWHLALSARLTEAAREAAEAQERRLAEAEEARREAELSTDLTHEQQAEVAKRRQDAAYARELSAAEQELESAQAQAAHEAELAKIRRKAAQQMEMDREDAEVIKQRVQLTREIQAGRGLALGQGEAAPDDLSSLSASPGAPPMGFSVPMEQSRGASPAPQSASRPSPEGLEPRLQALVDYIADAGEAASVRGAAKALDCDPASVRRRRDALAKHGVDVSVLSRTKQ